METSFRSFLPGDETAFRELNEEWIRAFFALEQKDIEVLHDPQKYILDPGGAIFVAVQRGRTIGCCALLRMDGETFEVGKMAVSPEVRGQGIGRQLLDYVIAQARRMKAARLFLETNRKLANAVHLYHAVGFRQIPEERTQPSPYSRSDLAMELDLA